MKFSMLASGSSGNATFLETDRLRLLIDVGLSGKQLEKRLQMIGIEAETIQALLISHEHIDHVKGLGVFARRYQLPIYLNQATWESLPRSVGEIPEELIHFIDTGQSWNLKNLHIETCPISHDAADPIAFRFTEGKESLAIVTDLGYVNQKMVDYVSGANSIIWESNHDIEMLRMSTYPWNVKRRILSDVGHLSNNDSGEALTEILRGNGEQVYLAHLSKDNNVSELAQMTVQSILEDAGFAMGRDVQLWQTYDDRPTTIQEVRGKVLK